MNFSFFHFFLFLSHLSLLIATRNISIPSCPHSQKSALLTLFSNRSYLPSWKPDGSDCCQWEGITCDQSTGRVTILDISGRSISSSINSTAFTIIPGIVDLDLSNNRFSGPITPLTQLTNLRNMDLSSNKFTGPITSLAQLTKLNYLDLSSNKFTSPITPLAQLTKLNYLNLSSNKFIGPITSLAQLIKLNYLNLSSNKFTGPITPLAQLIKLNYLDLSSNKFIGPITPLAPLTKLNYLHLSNNNFTGMIAVNVNGLSNLSFLDVRNNLLYGKIPSALFTLPSLSRLELSQNRFNDTLDEFINGSQSLEFIDLSKNNLQGHIPRSIFNLSSLRTLDISSNNFTGNVEIAVLQNLLEVDLGDNLLSIDDVSVNNSSSIPSFRLLGLSSCNLLRFPNFLRNQSTIDYLDLSNNKIRGEIPGWIWTFRERERRSTINRFLCARDVHRREEEPYQRYEQNCISYPTLDTHEEYNPIVEGIIFRYLNLSFNLLSSFEQSENLSFGSWNILDLHSNKLHGSIPLPPSNNIVLDYSNNCFTSLPANFTSQLNFTRFFSISGNNVSGEIPKSICSANSLEVLDLSYNKLKGSIPECLGEMSTQLAVLDLRNNSLSGTIPEIFRVGCTLRTLNLNGNRLYGKVQRSLGNCKQLEVLDLGNNQISDLIPSYWDSLMKLRVLILRSNKFHGTILQFDNFSFPMLQIIDLSSNNFSGNLPEGWFKTLSAMRSSEDDQVIRYGQGFATYGQKDDYFYYQDAVNVTSKNLNLELVKIRTIFTSIDLSNNNFEGAIPKVLGTLNSLHVLNMSGNDFSGSIPTSIGNLTQLESLDLSQNKLSGEIPFEMIRLTFLSMLNLSDNQLNGPIPQGLQFATFTNESFSGNPGLCGPPLSRRCDSGPVSVGVDSESESNINWFLISTLVGHFVGLGVIFFPLLFWRKWRRWYFRQMDKMLEKFSYWCQFF